MLAFPLLVSVAMAALGLIVPAYHSEHLVNQVLRVDTQLGASQDNVTLICAPNLNTVTIKQTLALLDCVGDCKNLWQQREVAVNSVDTGVLFIKDNLSLGDTVLSNVPMNLQNYLYATLSLGYGLWNQSSSDDDDLSNNWFLGYLLDEGTINEPKYSLHSDDDKWRFVFGGVDHAKYVGDLAELDIEQYSPLSNYLSQFVRSDVLGQVALKAVALDDDGSETISTESNLTLSISYNYGDVADMALPDDIYQTLAAKLNINTTTNTADCVSDDEIKLVLDFGITKINVPYISLQKKNDNGTCDVNIQGMKGNKKDVYVGPETLRSVYAVYDAGAKKVSIAQYKSLNDSDVEIFGESKAALTPESSSAAPSALASSSDASTKDGKDKQNSGSLLTPLLVMAAVMGLVVLAI